MRMVVSVLNFMHRQAGKVLLTGLGDRAPIPMTRGEEGLWSVTVGPLEPDLYSYHFLVDGALTIDPKNRGVKSGEPWHRWSKCPGSTLHRCMHGGMWRMGSFIAIYHSQVTGSLRSMLVYTRLLPTSWMLSLPFRFSTSCMALGMTKLPGRKWVMLISLPITFWQTINLSQ